jgi:hypothetical protein
MEVSNFKMRGNTITVKDASARSSIASINTSIGDIKGQIHTNLLNPAAKTQTINGVTFTNNGDGTYTVNGTASAEAPIILDNNFDITTFRGKSIRIAGCPSGGGANAYQLNINFYDSDNKNVGAAVDYGEGRTGNVPNYAHHAFIVIDVQKGQTANNLLFKPMLTADLSATYDDFVPYTGDSGRLNEDVASLVDIVKSIQNASFPVGHFIFTKTCDTESKVIANYGGVHWRRITDKFIGACGNVLSINGGGSNSVQLSASNIPSHSHSLSGTFTTSETTASHTHEFFTDEQGAHTHYVSTNSNDSVIRAGGTGFGGTGGDVTVQNASVLPTSSSGMHYHSGTTKPGGEAHTHDVTLSGSTGSTGSGEAFSIIPSYEGAYVWVREE